MTICVQVDTDGTIYAVQPQPVEVSACSYVLVSGDAALNSPFSLTPEQGAQVGGAVLLVWAVAYVFRVLARVLNVDEKGDST